MFSIKGERRPEYFVINIGLMMCLIVSLGLTAHFLPVDALVDRLSVIMTLVLTAITFKLLCSEKLPDLTYLTDLDSYILWGIAMLCKMAVSCVIASQRPENVRARFDRLEFQMTLMLWLESHVAVYKAYRARDEEGYSWSRQSLIFLYFWMLASTPLATRSVHTPSYGTGSPSSPQP